MTVTQVWFGTPLRPLAGWYHLPDDGYVRGGVVICPPFGMEAASAGSSLRQLAELLASAGFGALRLNYDGTGDSAGDDRDDGRLDAWLASIRSGLDFLREGGHAWLSVVGLRLGATLAAREIARNSGVDALVLWDPCVTGRTFLREQRLLLQLVSEESGEDDDGSAFGPGITFTRATVEELSALELQRDLGEVSGRVQLLTRRNNRSGAALAAEVARPGLDWREVSGQEELVGVEPALAEIPTDTLSGIVTWLAQHAPSDLAGVLTARAESAAVGYHEASGQIVEHAVSLGPDRQFGICTEPSIRTYSTSIIFLNAGVLDHVGPSRLWVELSRRWAALGFRSYRIDSGGVGESPPHPGMSDVETRYLLGSKQVEEVIAEISSGNPRDVLLVGLCAGGYRAMEAGSAQHVLAVFLVNPSFALRPPAECPTSSHTAEAARTGRLAGWYSALEQLKPVVPIARKAPDFIWRVMNRVGVRSSEAERILDLVAQGIYPVVLGNVDDMRVYTRGRKARLRHREREGRLKMVTLGSVDHTVFGPMARRRVADVLTDQLVEVIMPISRLAVPARSDTGREGQSAVDSRGTDI